MTLEAIVDDEFSEYLTKLRKLLSTQYHPLLEFDSVKRYLRRSFRDRSGGITPNTGKMYIQRLSDFCEQENWNPDEVATNAKKEPLLIKRHLENWFDYMMTNQDRDTAVGKVNTVLAFLGRNDVEREVIGYKIPQRKGQKERDYNWCPTREQLLQVFNLDVWKAKKYGKDMQPFLLAESQSGLSEIDLLTLDTRSEDAAKWAGFDYECIANQDAISSATISCRCSRRSCLHLCWRVSPRGPPRAPVPSSRTDPRRHLCSCACNICRSRCCRHRAPAA